MQESFHCDVVFRACLLGELGPYLFFRVRSGPNLDEPVLGNFAGLSDVVQPISTYGVLFGLPVCLYTKDKGLARTAVEIPDNESQSGDASYGYGLFGGFCFFVREKFLFDVGHA